MIAVQAWLTAAAAADFDDKDSTAATAKRPSQM